MSTASTKSPVPPFRSSPPPVAWRSWPIGQGGWTTWSLLAALAGVAAVVGYWTVSLETAALACGLVLAAAWRSWVPVTYEVNALGITQHALWRTRRYAWKSIEKAEIGRRGVFLALDGAVLASLRGLYLPWDDHRDEVTALVEYYLPSNRRSPSGGSTVTTLPERPSAGGNPPSGNKITNIL